MSRVTIFNNVLNALKLKEPVPVDVQDFILSYKMKSLIITLKNFGEYNTIYGLVLRIYFYTKRIGLRLSVMQAKLLLGIISALVVSIVSAGIVFSAVHYKQGKSESIKDRLLGDNTIHERRTERIVKKDPNTRGKIREELSSRLGISIFNGDIIDKTILKDVEENIVDGLIKIKGANRIIHLRRGRGGKNVNLLLMGSVEKLGSNYIITAKVVDVEKSRVIFITSENVDSRDDFKEACSRIARRVAGKVE